MNATKALILLGMGAVATVAGQQAPEPPTFRVGVDVVSVDVVVTDRKGQSVRDLQAADFEVLQDGKPQRVTSVTFVPVDVGVERSTSPAGQRGENFPSANDAAPVRMSPPTREQVRRTIVLVVDDLGLSSQGMRTLLPALRRFVDTELMATDVMAIVRTGESNGLAQSLTNDRSVLRGAIDALRYNVLSRKGPWSSGDVVQLGFKPPEFDGPMRPLSQIESLSALKLIVQSARDLPGRKTVIFASEGFQLTSGTAATTLPDQDPRLRDALDRVTDQAARSGVVLYAIDCTGLETGGLRASDDIHYVPNMTEAVNRFGAARQRMIRDAQQSLAYLTEQTGGFAVVNTNDLADGLKRIGNDVGDYYIIGYEPEEGTFVSDRKLAKQHNIAVKIRRADLRVRARKAFTGVSDPERPSAPPTPAEALVRAAMSPFSSGGIGLQTTNLFGYSAERGVFVRSVLRVDAHALTFAADGSGSKTATVDVVGLVFDSDGALAHNLSTGFNVALDGRAAEQVLQDGLTYAARLPIPQPGGYQLRFAVRDRRSGAIGKGGGFVLVPDVAGGAFALSGIVLRTAQRAASSEPLDSDRFSIAPADANRVYAPGTQLAYSYEVYNAGPAVETVATLWRGDEKLVSLPAETIVPPPAGRRWPAAGRFKLADDLVPGAYVLQITATSTTVGPKRDPRVAVQRLSFDVER